ncbi:MAG TPA: hypothetical protein VIM12_00725 [Noviherbaspirillum sp.]|jgi:hypothetical protein|uniref:hypothetical protein n=1 Tax=Noviherbaspirillum sp. TaxID=1926288 RepID=UPI002F929EB1
MKAKLIAIVLASAASAALSPAYAQHPGTVAEWEQRDIRARIDQGLRSGALTQGEASQLYQRERELDRLAARIEQDGRVSPHEHRQVRDAVASLRADVDRKLSNRRDAYSAAPGILREQQQVHQRIEDGVASGGLTYAEARRLAEREREVQRLHASMQRDGVVTQGERSRLRGQLAALNDEIDRLIGNHRRVHYTR